MRIAHVLHVATSTPIVALERDGALYDVAELECCFGTKFAAFARASSFYKRVIALGCAGFDVLDDRLQRGDRPSRARLQAGAFLWLPPCDVDRVAYLQFDAYDATFAPRLKRPTYRIGNVRGLVGHAATIVFPDSESQPDYELNLAAVLGDDLHRATSAQTQRAIVGYTILNDWTGRTLEAEAKACGLSLSEAKDFATQLGPVLVTQDEVGAVESLRAQVRVNAETYPCSFIGKWRFSLAESVAYLSNHIELRAGDVIGAGCVIAGSAASTSRRVDFGSTVELLIERIGTLSGRPIRRPKHDAQG